MLQYAAPPAEHHRPAFLEPPSRPQSTKPAFNTSLPKPSSEQSHDSSRSPALSALASLAASVPAAPLLDEKERYVNREEKEGYIS